MTHDELMAARKALLDLDAELAARCAPGGIARKLISEMLEGKYAVVSEVDD